MTQARAPDADVYIEINRRLRAVAAAPPHGRIRDAEFQTVRPGRKRRRAGFSIPAIPLDGLYAFALMVAMLFVQQAGALSGLAISVLPLIYIGLHRRVLQTILSSRWLILLIPVFTLASVLWSEAPEVSAKYGAEMLLTAAAGACLAIAMRPDAVLKGLCLGVACYMAAALAFGHSVAMGLTGEAFTGLGDGKNLLADIGCTGVLLSAAVAAIAARDRDPCWLAVALLAATAEFYGVYLAHSAGAILALAAGLGALVVLIALHATPRVVRIGAATVAVLSAGIMVAAVRNIAAALIDLSAQLFDKDPTLTGRTYLWYRAHDLIAEKPWLGRGYFAFWRQGNIDAEGLWRFAGIGERRGFNFHNSLVELTVQLGMIGAAIFCIVALVGLLALAWRFITAPSLSVCFWLAFFIYTLVRTPMEAIGYSPFYFSTVLLFAAISRGLERAPRRQVYRVQARRRPSARVERRGVMTAVARAGA